MTRERGRREPAAGAAPRATAVALLGGVLGDGRRLSEVVADTPAFARLSPPERARARHLATETLRQLSRLDRVLAEHLRRAPPLAARNILRVAAWELLAEGAAPHGVVSAAVEVARRTPGAGRHSGLVNAVLRGLVRRMEEGALGPDTLAAMEPPRLPNWLRGRLSAAWGGKAVAAFERAHALRPPVDLTLRDPETAPTWAERLGAQILPTGSLRLSAGRQISALPGYAEGAWWVQDAAAALPVRALGVRPGMRVLDLCAAPGGKTMQLAAAGARVTALDISEARLRRLSENLTRTGLSAELVVADACDWSPEHAFDAIVLDAPCSATGTIRRHPDLPHVRDRDLGALTRLQARLLQRAASWLSPGGRLMYCTCSLLPDEGEVQARAATERLPALKRLSIDAGALGVPPEWIDAEGGLRTRPDAWAETGGLDGFYAALFERRAQDGLRPAHAGDDRSVPIG
ncbi:MAG: methyltransferase domain-containing protein [Alphaproteobacteria bacterium]|nr:MAG: methyltransferase domain-containing protein [Alphaproteobacteria bacterium]